MAWYYESGITWQKRLAVACQTIATSGTDASIYLAIPVTWDDFWSVIDSSGEEVRFTDADGVTLCDYEIDSFTLSTRTAAYNLEPGYNASQVAGTMIAWLYYDPIGSPSDLSTSLGVQTENGRISLTDPELLPDQVVVATRPAPGTSEPADTVTKAAAEDILVWFRFDQLLAKRTGSQLASDRDDYEELQAIQVEVLNSGGTDQSGMRSDALNRAVYTQDGRLYLGVYVTGGSDGTDYTVRVEATTSYDSQATVRTLEAVCKLEVRDIRIP